MFRNACIEKVGDDDLVERVKWKFGGTRSDEHMLRHLRTQEETMMHNQRFHPASKDKTNI